MFNKKNEMWFAEYSVKQKCFHLGKARELCRKNREAIRNGLSLDFIPIIWGPEEVCKFVIEEFKKELAEKGE